MKTTTLLAIALIAVSNGVVGKNIGCDAALQPSVSTAKSNYAIAQAYMFVNASKVYEEMKSNSSSGSGGSIGAELFSAEYKSSNSASEFELKVQERLSKEGFSLDESQSRSSYHRYLSNQQLTEWSNCVKTVSGGGAVIITANFVSDSSFPITVQWFPQHGVGQGTLHVKVSNATIENGNSASYQLVGAGSKPLIVQPDKSNRPIVITAEIASTSDMRVLPRSFPTARLPVPAALPQKQRTRIVVPAKSFLRSTNVALGGPSGVYGADVLLNAAPYGDVPNAAEFEFRSTAAGSYMLRAEYASADKRPIKILINGTDAVDDALNVDTGCWYERCQQILNQNTVTLKEGLNVMRIQRGSFFPHIRTFIFDPN